AGSWRAGSVPPGFRGGRRNAPRSCGCRPTRRPVLAGRMFRPRRTQPPTALRRTSGPTPAGGRCAASCRRPDPSCARPLSRAWSFTLDQSKQPGVKKLAVLEEVLPQVALLPETALFKDTGRRRVVREDVGGDLRQPELLEGVPAHPLHNGGHDPTA